MELNAIFAKQKLSTTLNEKISQYTDYTFPIEDCAFVFSENRGKWNGPFIATCLAGKMVTVKTLDETHKHLINSF